VKLKHYWTMTTRYSKYHRELGNCFMYVTTLGEVWHGVTLGRYKRMLKRLPRHLKYTKELSYNPKTRRLYRYQRYTVTQTEWVPRN